MLELTRTVRFAVCDAPTPDARAGHNTFAGSPSMHGLGRHYELDVTCLGDADAVTGYFINIREIDRAVRTVAVPVIEQACRDTPSTDPASLLPSLLTGINTALIHACSPGRATSSPVPHTQVVRRLRWHLTPYYSVEMNAADSTSRPPRVLIRQQFEFAASHRLHVPVLSDERNRAIFGKCNLPSGHGHNYRVEPCIDAPISSDNPFTLGTLERLTSQHIIQRFDHKHLNLDTPEFAAGSLNPSVENIAKVCFDLLAPAIVQTNTGATLRSMTVWETDKTSCTYPV